MKKGLIEKIKSRGYWRINFQPIFCEQKLKLSECRELVEGNKVLLRGWDYPHCPVGDDKDSGLVPCQNYYEGWIDYWNMIEFWRMYESSQFLHYLALREDWAEDDGFGYYRKKNIKPMTVIGITGSIIYQITEVYVFLSRISSRNIYKEGVRVSISLNNTKDRTLWIEDIMRGGFFREYKTGADKIEYMEKHSIKDIVAKPKELAFDAIVFFFERFGWTKPSIDIIKNDQDHLLNLRT
jgi:hypothetical protein